MAQEGIDSDEGAWRMKRNIIASDEIKVELTFPDLVAILAIDEVLAEHLESVEDKLDPGITPSDRVRGAIAVLTRDRENAAAHWLTRFDPDDGDPYGTVCRCKIGSDHDSRGNLVDDEL